MRCEFKKGDKAPESNTKDETEGSNREKKKKDVMPGEGIPTNIFAKRGVVYQLTCKKALKRKIFSKGG